MRAINLLSGLMILCMSCTNTGRKVDNIQTFAKVYGYVRWFYPGDEAAQTNWDKFAVYGVSKVENARNQKELKNILLELFKPIAPALVIDDAGKIAEFNLSSIQPNDTTGFHPVSWVHYGVHLGEKSNIYKSVRSYRETSLQNKICLSYGTLDISKYMGKEVKLVVTLKVPRQVKENAYLFLASFAIPGPEYMDNLTNNLLVVKPTEQWGSYEHIIKLNQNDTFLAFAIGMDKEAPLYLSRIKMMVKELNTWKLAEDFPLDFNDSNWGKNYFLYDFNTDSNHQKKGEYFVAIKPKIQRIVIGKSIRKAIGNNLSCTMPLALYGNNTKTFPVADESLLKLFREQLDQIPDSSLNTKNMNARLANIVITWNVFQHFYPYFDVVKVDWEAVLPQTLGDIYKGKSETDYYKSLCRMVAKIEDGHGVVFNDKIVKWGLPVTFAWIEKKAVITASNSASFLRGDIIENIDDKSAADELQEQESYISGSPQLRRYRAMNMFGTDFSQNEATVILFREGKKIKIKAKREIRSSLFYNSIDNWKLKSKDCGNGIYFVHNGQDDFKTELDHLSKAKGIIVSSLFDLFNLIPHIVNKPAWSTMWNIPVFTYPDRENITFENNRWKIEPQKPFLTAKIAFIEEPFNVSSGETARGIIDHYKLGKLVGDTTAGTNGNVNFIPLMGGYSIMWTGMKVLKHDGSQLHLIGFRPDYPVNRTIKAIKEERNEYLDKALEVLKKEIENP